MAKPEQQPEVIKGTATHRRTEVTYMAALLEAVPLDAWREIVAATVQAAKAGDASARAWLGQYLIGKPDGKAPTPLTVIIGQLNGSDPVVNGLAAPLVEREHFGDLFDDSAANGIRAIVAAELAKKLPSLESTGKTTAAGDSGDSTP